VSCTFRNKFDPQIRKIGREKEDRAEISMPRGAEPVDDALDHAGLGPGESMGGGKTLTKNEGKKRYAMQGNQHAIKDGQLSREGGRRICGRKEESTPSNSSACGILDNRGTIFR